MAKGYGLWSLVVVLCLSLALATTVLVLAKPLEGQSVSRERPNIIFVMTNDQSPNTLEHMPFVSNTLMPNATTFPNATFNFPLCCPSRTSMLRGQYAHNHGIWENRKEKGGGYEVFLQKGLHLSTFPSWLVRSGYRSGGFGHYVNQWFRARHGFPKGFHFYRDASDRWDLTYIPLGYERDVGVRDNAVRWLRENINVNPGRKGEVPLFMWVSFFAPHHPYYYDPAYAGSFSDTQLPRPASFDEVDVSDKPAYVQGKTRFTDAQIGQLTEDHRNRLRGLLTADQALRSMTNVLRDAGELDNTYIVFWTDNGYQMGEHRLMYKRHPYVESVSFPMVVSGPGVRKGAVDDRVVMNQDLAPTFADIAGATAGSFVDGRSFLPLLGREGQTARWRDVGLIEGSPALNAGYPTEYRGLRDEDYTYVEYVTGEKEYYDLRADPHQLNNAYPSLSEDRRSELAAKLARLKTCSRQDCRDAEGSQGPP